MPECEKCHEETDSYSVDTSGYLCDGCWYGFIHWNVPEGGFYRDFLKDNVPIPVKF